MVVDQHDYSESTLYEAIEPVINAYEKYYDIIDTDLEGMTVTDKENGSYDVDYYLNMKVKLKADSAAELPQIRGIADALNVEMEENSTEKLVSEIKSDRIEKELNKETIKIIDTYRLDGINTDNLSKTAMQYATKELADFVQTIEEDYIGKVSEINISLRSQFDKNGNLIKQLYEAFDGYTDDISIVTPDTEANMIKQGREQVTSSVIGALKKEQSAQKISASPMSNSFTYYRVNARDYANTYTSNATSHNCGLSSHNGTSVKQNASKYNKNYNWFCSNDCANYVSQAMNAGGVPRDSSWKPGNLYWQKCSYMKNYFTNIKNWWDTSNYTNCNAGGIILLCKAGSTSPYHAMMVVGNDTVTHTYSAHTTDRLKQPFSSTYFGSDRVEYYRFSNVYPAH